MNFASYRPVRRLILFLILAALVPFANSALPQIDCAFPGGNILVDQIEEKLVRLRPDRRDTQGWWFYWYFRVQGAAGRTLRFEFTDGEPVGVRGPALSSDAGETWRWLGAKAGNNRSFTYAFPSNAAEVRFAFTIPYLQSHWERFIRSHLANAKFRPAVLCPSRKNRSVEYLYLGNNNPRHRLLLTARHHACEAMASYALEGFLETILKADTEEGRWLAEHLEVLAVPFVDKDGVEDGDQGKNRRPHDHNRDYSADSIYPEVAALRRLVPEWNRSAGVHVANLHAFDLHCPWIRGAHNEEIYIVGSSSPQIWKEQQRFGQLLQTAAQGPLPYRAADNLPYGTAWNKGGNYNEGKSCGHWASELPGIQLVASLEIPYANARGAEFNPASARAFGRDLARALARYLQN